MYLYQITSSFFVHIKKKMGEKEKCEPPITVGTILGSHYIVLFHLNQTIVKPLYIFIWKMRKTLMIIWLNMRREISSVCQSQNPAR